MAEEPPPMDFEEAPEKEEEGENVQLTKAVVTEEQPPPVQLEAQEEEEEEDRAREDPPSLGAETTPEPPQLMEVPKPPASAPPPTLEAHAADEGDDSEPVKPAVHPARTLDLFEEEPPEHTTFQEQEEEEEAGKYELEIRVTHPEKIGEGMAAYMVYTVSMTTTLPSFKSPESSVRRRFSDFLRLHNKMVERHLLKGRIVPPAPEKSVKGMTTVKFSKSEESGAAFLERRQASLERYLNRIARHPVLRKDLDFMEFLENPNELPKAKETNALSGAGFMRLVKNVGQSISKIASKKSETDSWFDEQQQNYEALDIHLKKLHQAVEGTINCRKDLCATTGNFVKGVATLGNVEENNTVSRALSRLSEVQEKVENLHTEQTKHDLYTFGETMKDYVSLLGAIRAAFDMRLRAYGVWQQAQQTLSKKREQEQKLTVSGKTEKLQQIKAEIAEWEGKLEESQKVFEDSSKTLKDEITRFESERAQEFKTKIISYLEALMHMQQELIRLWEGYLPDAQAIVAE